MIFVGGEDIDGWALSDRCRVPHSNSSDFEFDGRACRDWIQHKVFYRYLFLIWNNFTLVGLGDRDCLAAYCASCVTDRLIALHIVIKFYNKVHAVFKCIIEGQLETESCWHLVHALLGFNRWERNVLQTTDCLKLEAQSRVKFFNCKTFCIESLEAEAAWRLYRIL